MAYMWPSSLVPWLDAYGNPYAGAKAFFFSPDTTTPKTTYTDGDLSTPHDHPVVANGFGRFPAVFLNGAGYRVRIEASDGTTLEDVDNISIPVIDDDEGGGDTPTELLMRTAHVIFAYRTGVLSGYVRANGRTIGDGISGATERANADCETLFTHLWDADPNLPVSGGRGGSAASDWAASKNIGLPDMRGRAPFGLADMGSSAENRIASSLLDGSNTDLGATGGDDEITLSIDQIPVHNHPGSTNTTGNHTHSFQTDITSGGSRIARGQGGTVSSQTTSSNGAHAHTVTTENRGGGDPHSNLPPAILGTWYIKL